MAYEGQGAAGGAASGAASGFMVGGPVGAVVGGILGGVTGFFGGRAKKKEAKRRRQIAEYNAKVAMMNAEARKEAIDYKSRLLINQQREFKAQQRMNVAARGGFETGTDLRGLIESAKNMQLDLLELVRQQDIAIIEGQNQAQQIRMGAQAEIQQLKSQSKQGMISGFTDLLMVGASKFANPKNTQTDAQTPS
tara:strand:- start:7253 stop:7831 length:579 start_codon:yes stop_codon:yes gene_type:complete